MIGSTSLRKRWGQILGTVAFLADAVIITVAVVASSAGGAEESAGTSGTSGGLLLAALAAFLPAAVAAGLYRMITHLPARAHAAVAGRAFLWGAPLFLLLTLPGASGGQVPAPVVLLLFLLPCCYTAGWAVLRQVLRRARAAGYGRARALLVGSEEHTTRWRGVLESIPELGHDVVLVSTPDDPGLDARAADARVHQVLGVLDDGPASAGRIAGLARRLGAVPFLLRPGTPLPVQRPGIRDPLAVPLTSPRPAGTAARLLDVLVAGLLLLLLSPLFLLIAVAIRMESHGPVLFRQRRALGGDDPPFQLLKFRSMVLEADEIRDTLIGLNEADGVLFKIREDPRRTRVGRLLRRHSLDELPQLINVLRGEMRLVGPRPLPVEDLARIPAGSDLAFLAGRRASCRPGMTGLWQITGRDTLGFRDMLLLDLAYAGQRSLLFDLEILVRTVPVVLFGRGAW
jgi:lipopolysaccharide/colanic/teichoic acid biosynthesis glycosyltransferase